jgi:hypothetical protein
MAIGGGYQNSIENNYSVIMGGSRNSITNASNADGNVSVIGGGNYNTTACAYSFMGGGAYNKIGGDSTSYDGTSQCNVIVGGYYNAVERDNLDCFIGGGRQNTIEGLLDNGNYYSSIVGGRGNAIGDPSHSGTDPGCQWAFIGGGYNNTISRYADNSVIVGGYLNTIAGSPGDPSTACFIGGGSQNTITNTEYSSILGGFKNTIENCDSGHSCIVGGYDNSISGASYSVAMGRHALVDDFASFCWNSDDSIRESDGDYSFSVHCEWAHFSSFSSLGGSSSEENNWNTDFAELIPIGEKDIAEGDLVATKYPAKLGKTAEAYDPDLIGLVSSDRTRLIMMKCAKANKENSRYIALVGVVFCNVCDEGGPIALGDPITASSIPGVGMKADKACKIVGYAMDNFTEKRGEVLIFCNVGYYIPPEEYLELEASIEELEAYAKNQ